MLLLFETAAGHALFELQNAAKLKKIDAADLYTHFSTAEQCSSAVKLKAFQSFKDTAEAVAAATDAVESKMGKPLKKFLTKHVGSKKMELGVADPKLGAIIKEKLGIACAHGAFVNEAMRGARAAASGAYYDANQSTSSDDATALDGVASRLEVKAMQLGLSHSLSRYKLKFSPDKVDTMVVQAVGLLDDLDKEVNTYAMRVREWYGWHFPEMAKIVNDNLMYAKIVLAIGGYRSGLRGKFDVIEAILDEDSAKTKTLMETAEISMGTEVDENDMIHITALASEVVELTTYRAELAEYLRNRMQAIAPNLTVLVGELVGARLVQHAGSIMNLAKHPASTVQILGAEKALFRALKTKHDTPKYGLIYHASLIGQAAPKNKGKISRVLAAKCSLAVRVDALGEDEHATMGYEARAKVEARLRQLEGGTAVTATKAPASSTKKIVEVVKEGNAAADGAYNDASDMTMEKKKKKKKKLEEDPTEEEKPKKKKKKSVAADDDEEEAPKKKKKKKKESTD